MSHEPHRSPLRHLDFTSVRLLYWRRVLGTILLSAGVERATNWATWLARNVFDLSPPARQKIESNLATTYGPTLSADQRSRLARETFDAELRVARDGIVRLDLADHATHVLHDLREIERDLGRVHPELARALRVPASSRRGL